MVVGAAAGLWSWRSMSAPPEFYVDYSVHISMSRTCCKKILCRPNPLRQGRIKNAPLGVYATNLSLTSMINPLTLNCLLRNGRSH